MEKLVFFAAVFLLLLVVFVVSKIPQLVVDKLELQLQEDIRAIEQGRELVGQLAHKLESLQEDIRNTHAALQQIQQRRRQLQTMWNAITSLLTRQDTEQQMRELEAAESAAHKRLNALQGEVQAVRTNAQLTDDQILQREIILQDRQRQLRDVQGFQESLSHVLRNQMGAIALKALLIVLAAVLLPIAWRVVAFYLLAPLARRCPPIRLLQPAAAAASTDPEAFPASQPAIRIAVSPNDELLIKESFLQSSTEGSHKRTCFLFNWRYPFTSLASGLYLLIRIRHRGEDSGASVHVTLSCQKDPTLEVAAVNVQHGEWLCFRPSYVAGLVYPADNPPTVRSIWVFGRLLAWVHLRFRYLLIRGPVSVIFAAQRGVQFEAVEATHAGRRVNSFLTVAFSPELDHSPRRAETFIAYLRGANPLFDDFFTGSGKIIYQQVGDGRGSAAGRIWDSLFNAFRKLFGL